VGPDKESSNPKTVGFEPTSLEKLEFLFLGSPPGYREYIHLLLLGTNRATNFNTEVSEINIMDSRNLGFEIHQNLCS